MIQIVNSHTHSPTNDDVYIGRPSLFGNPVSHRQESTAVIQVETRENAVQAYEDWLLGRDYTDDGTSDRKPRNLFRGLRSLVPSSGQVNDLTVEKIT